MKKYSKNILKRRLAVRSKIKRINSGLPRLSVFRSGKHIYAQIIDLGKKGKVLLSLSDIKLKDAEGNKTAKASQTGKSLAKQALKLGIKKVVFDRSGHSFAGRLAALARTAREGGLKF